MLKTIRLAGTIAFAAIALSMWGAVEVNAQQPDNTPKCCVCFFADCCFLIPQEQCDANGELINPQFLHTFFQETGIESNQVCSFCDRCAINPFTPEEDARYLTTCDVCVLKPAFDEFSCKVLPPDVVAEFTNGEPSSCRLTKRSVSTPGALIFLGSIFILGAFRARYKKSVRVSKCNVKS